MCTCPLLPRCTNGHRHPDLLYSFLRLVECKQIKEERHVRADMVCLFPACKDHGVECLVYTSTYNVIFGGEAIENGDESLPYLPQHKVHTFHQ